MRCRRESIETGIPPTSLRYRSGHASSKSTPSIAVRKSMRLGGRPIWYTTSGCVNVSCVSLLRGAPNRSRARHRRAAFSAVGRTQRSMSPVALGIPWPATAYPPTIRYSTPSSANALNISAKSRFIACLSTESPGGNRERPDHLHSFGRGHCRIRIGFRLATSPDPFDRSRGPFAADRHRGLLGGVGV